MQKHKGTAYDPKEVIAEAIKKTGWSPELFFANAKIFSGANGFDVKTAAQRFADFLADPVKNSWEIPRPAIAFADWVLVTDERRIFDKYHKTNSRAAAH